METFLPKTTEPATELLDAVESFLRTGHPVLHDPLPPPWPKGAPCPAGHFTLPAGLYLYRTDIPEEASTPYLAIGVNGDCERHVLDFDCYWNIEIACHLVENRDRFITDDPPQIMRELQNDLLADARMETDPPQEFPAVARLSGPALNVFYLYNVKLQKVALFNGHPAHTLLFTARCSGKNPEQPPPPPEPPPEP